nr:MAG TPA: hypothetical protein [Caudoviricetes sp.]
MSNPPISTGTVFGSSENQGFSLIFQRFSRKPRRTLEDI